MHRMTIMSSAYEDFASGSQSPYNVGRGAHPGAVLLSPQSSVMNLSNSAVSATVLSPQLTAQSHNLSFNEMLDQQSLLLDPTGSHSQQSNNMSSTHSAAGSAVMSPMIQSPSRTPTNAQGSSMFLDSFTSSSSNNVVGMHNRSQSLNKSKAQQNLGQTQTVNPKSSQSKPRGQGDVNPVVNFTQDINQLCSWMSMLSSVQQNTVIDNLLSTLNEDVLQYTKLKLDSLMNSGYISPQIPAIASPVPNRESYSITNLDSVFSNERSMGADSDTGDHLDPSVDHSVIYQQWSPQPTSMTQLIYDYIKEMNQRPKSADPHVSKANINHTVKKPASSHNFNTQTNFYSASTKNRNFNGDFGTANSHTYYGGNRQQPTSNMHMNTTHSSLSPDHSPNSTSSSHTGNVTPNPTINAIPGASNGGGNGHGSSMNPRTLTDPRLLTNIPVWLKSLRLHKYSDALSSKKWDELIYLDDDALEKMGISALGARRKLLKAFAIVRDHKDQGLIDQTAYVS